MNEWKRCALLEGHRGPCAAWPGLADDKLPRNGTRCGSAVAPRVEIWQRVVTRHDLADETRRRDVLAWCRIADAHRGYRGRISFVRVKPLGPPAGGIYAIRVHPAIPRPAQKAST